MVITNVSALAQEHRLTVACEMLYSGDHNALRKFWCVPWEVCMLGWAFLDFLLLGRLRCWDHSRRRSLVCGVVLWHQLPGVPLTVLALLPAERHCRFRAPFLCWVSLSTLLLPASTLLAVVLRVLMDLFGSVRRDGLSVLASSPLRRLPLPPPRHGNSCSSEGKFVSSFLWIIAVLYVPLVTPEDVFIVPNCMLESVGFSAHTLFVPPDGFNFLGLARSNLGSLHFRCSASTRRIQLHV